MKQILVLSFICLLLLTGCISSKKQVRGKQYSQNGLSFYCPAGWQLIENEQTNYRHEWFADCEKQGETQSGLALFRWTNKDIEQTEFFNTYKDEFSLAIEGQGSHINYKFKNETEIEYFYIAGAEKIRGSLETKTCKNVRVVWFMQSLDSEWQTNKKDFKQMRESIRCD